MNKNKKVLHVNYIFGNPFTIPIAGELNNLQKVMKKNIFTNEYKNLALSLENKLQYLPYITKRCMSKHSKIRYLVNNRNRSNKRAIMIANDLKYKLTIDIDSFLYETVSVCELLEKYSDYIFDKILNNKIDVIRFFEQMFREASIDTAWHSLLGKHRNAYIHNTSLFFDIKLTDNGDFEDIILNDYYHNKKKEFSFKELNNIFQGMRTLLLLVGDSLLKSIRGRLK